MGMPNNIDRLQKYAATRVKDAKKDVIWAQNTNSAYFNFNGSTLRISDHLPLAEKANTAGVTMSIIMTPNKDQYVLQQHSTGLLSVVNYEKAKEIVRSFQALSDIFKYPVTPFKLEKEFVESITASDKSMILGMPSDQFTKKQLLAIKAIVNQAKQRRMIVKSNATKVEKATEHITTPSK